jgi:hypothetical protein
MPPSVCCENAGVVIQKIAANMRMRAESLFFEYTNALPPEDESSPAPLPVDILRHRIRRAVDNG